MLDAAASRCHDLLEPQHAWGLGTPPGWGPLLAGEAQGGEDPKEGLGVLGEVVWTPKKRGRGRPGHHPPGLTRSSPPGTLCPAEGECWHARSGDGRLPWRFLLRQVYFVGPRAALGQHSGHGPMGLGWGLGGEGRGGRGGGGPSGVFVPQPKTITNDASSQKSQAGGQRGMCQPAKGRQMCSSSSRAAAPQQCPICHPRAVCPTVSAHPQAAIARVPVPHCTLPLVFLQCPPGARDALDRVLAALGTSPRVAGGEPRDGSGKNTLGCKVGGGCPGCHQPPPNPPSMSWGTGAPQGPALSPGLSTGARRAARTTAPYQQAPSPWGILAPTSSGSRGGPSPSLGGVVGGGGGAFAEPELRSMSLPPPRSCAADGLGGSPAWRRAEHPEGGAVPAGGPGWPRPEGLGTSPGQEKQEAPAPSVWWPRRRTPQSAWNNSPRAGARCVLSKGPSSARPPWGWWPGGPGEGCRRGELLHACGAPAVPSQRRQGPVPPCHPGPALGPWGRRAPDLNGEGCHLGQVTGSSVSPGTQSRERPSCRPSGAEPSLPGYGAQPESLWGHLCPWASAPGGHGHLGMGTTPTAGAAMRLPAFLPRPRPLTLATPPCCGLWALATPSCPPRHSNPAPWPRPPVGPSPFRLSANGRCARTRRHQ